MSKHRYAFFSLLCVAIMSCAGGGKPKQAIPEAIHEETVQEQDEASPEIQEDETPSDVPEAAVIPEYPPEEESPINLIEPELALAETETAAPQEAPPPPVLPEPEPQPAQASVQPQSETVAAIPPQPEPPPVTPPPPVVPPAPPPQAVEPPPPPAVPPPPAPPLTQNQPPEQEPVDAQPPLEPESQEQAAATAGATADTGEEEIIFSRIVRATVGQLLEIPFRGTGWVYLGELSAQRGVEYSSRRLDPEGQSFVFQIQAAGTYALKFYKQDFIRNYILNDYVQVIVGQPPEISGAGWFNPPLDRGRVIAEPRWPTSLEEAELIRNGGRRPAAQAVSADDAPPETVAPPAPAESVQAAQPQAVSPQAAQTPVAPPATPAQAGGPPAAAGDAVPPPSAQAATPAQAAGLGPATPPDIFLQKAREEFDAGKPASALAILNQFIEYYPAGSDEAFWLYGQAYEANSPSRNILTALDYYRRLISEYPQSSRYNDARRRIAYLERFYINIQ